VALRPLAEERQEGLREQGRRTEEGGGRTGETREERGQTPN